MQNNIKKRLSIILIYLSVMSLWTFVFPLSFIGGKYVKTGEEILSYGQGLGYWLDYYPTRIIILLCITIVVYQIVCIFREYYLGKNIKNSVLSELEDTFTDTELCSIMSDEAEDGYISDNESW